MNTRIKAQDYRKLPLVYACSGCSIAAQAANYIALKLDREGDAEMSCIVGVGVGVGGNVPHSVNMPSLGSLLSLLMVARWLLRCIVFLNAVSAPTFIYYYMSMVLKNSTTPSLIRSTLI